MGIVSSELIEDITQAEGARRITEKHTDHLGVDRFVSFIVHGPYNATDAMNARVPAIEARLADKEDSQAIVDCTEYGHDPLTYNFEWSTARRFIRKLVRYGMRSKDIRVVFVLKPVIDYLEANYTAQQIATYLNTTIAVLSRIKTRVNDLWAIKTTIDADEGRIEEIE